MPPGPVNPRRWVVRKILVLVLFLLFTVPVVSLLGGVAATVWGLLP